MGQKVNPHGLRVGVIQDWDAKWIADKKNFAKFIKEDDTLYVSIRSAFNNADSFHNSNYILFTKIKL